MVNPNDIRVPACGRDAALRILVRRTLLDVLRQRLAVLTARALGGGSPR